jgi:hypothetical protein
VANGGEALRTTAGETDQESLSAVASPLETTAGATIFAGMLRFDQERVCEAIIRHLEARESLPRADLCLRDQGANIAGADSRVEMTFRLGKQLYALEHTGIEPFDGSIEMNNEADRLFEPLRQSLTGALDPSSAFELTIQLHSLRWRRMNVQIRGR